MIAGCVLKTIYSVIIIKDEKHVRRKNFHIHCLYVAHLRWSTIMMTAKQFEKITSQKRKNAEITLEKVM